MNERSNGQREGEAEIRFYSMRYRMKSESSKEPTDRKKERRRKTGFEVVIQDIPHARADTQKLADEETKEKTEVAGRFSQIGHMQNRQNRRDVR